MKSLPHIVEKVFCEPWLITPAAHAAIVRVLSSHIDGSARDATDICGEAVEVPELEIDENTGIATIPIGGVMGRKLSGFERGAGAVDMLDVMAELDIAEEDERVRAIILDVDSPGGMVNGTPELGRRVAASSKPVFAWTGGMMASAAYWVSAPAKAIYAAPSADVGSIGVYVPHFDMSRMYSNAGVDVELFRSGKYKGMGFPGVSLSDAEREMMQARVNEIAGEFYGHVRQHRGNISQEVMQGQVLSAANAERAGLIDGRLDSYDEVVATVLASLG